MDTTILWAVSSLANQDTTILWHSLTGLFCDRNIWYSWQLPESGNGRASGRLSLHLARPNPAAGRAEIVFSVPTSTPVQLRIFDPSGRLVPTLANDTMASGTYRVAWDGEDEAGKNVATGIYFYEPRAPESRESPGSSCGFVRKPEPGPGGPGGHPSH